MMFHKACYVICLLLYVFYETSQNSDEGCNCGFGGLCAKDENVQRTPCSNICPLISEGFYESGDQCRTIVNHCASSPCTNGSCVPTFGGYFCECPNELVGQNCDIEGGDFKGIGLKPEIYTYYQVQPRDSTPNLFTVVYEPLADLKDKNNHYRIQMEVNISDGRSYQPKISNFLHIEVKNKCLDDAGKNPTLRDIRVCDYLPSGNVSTFTFDPSYHGLWESESLTELEGLVKIEGLGVIGRVMKVLVEVFLFDLNDENLTILLFSQTYQALTYFKFRTPHNCLIELFFTYCSNNPHRPYVHARGTNIQIDLIHRSISCFGAILIGSEWRIQRHTDSLRPLKEKDYMPIPANGTNVLEFSPRFFTSGVHMIEHARTLRGNPPHYGGTGEFKMYGRCWIMIVTESPIVLVEGGLDQSVSCFRPMVLQLININPDIDIKEIRFAQKCNDTSDIECKFRYIEAPIITKGATKCQTYIRFEIEIWVPITKELDILPVHVHFIESPASLSIECLYNCFPIDPELRTILVATSKRFVTFPVKWEVRRAVISYLEEVKERDGEIRAFVSRSTRIIRINSNRFTGEESVIKTWGLFDVFIPGTTAQARVQIPCEDMKVNINTFNLEISRPGTIVFRSSYIEPYPSPPVVYRIMIENGGYLVEVLESNYEEDLHFTVFTDTVALCVYNAYSHAACGPLHYVEVDFKPMLTIEHLKSVYESGDYYNFFRKAFIYFLTNIKVTEDSSTGEQMREWNVTILERLVVMRLVNKVPRIAGKSKLEYALHCAVMNMYGPYNKLEGLPEFNEISVVQDLDEAVSFLQLRHECLSTILRTTKARYDLAVKYRDHPYGAFDYGTFRRLILDGLTLAYLQGNVKIEFRDPLPRIDRKNLAGTSAFWNWKSEALTRRSYNATLKLLSYSTVLFFGIITYGHHYTRIWAVRTTYIGILDAINKTAAKERVEKENFNDCADYIFGRGYNSGVPEDHWPELFEVELPPYNIDWEYLELALVAMAMKNRQGDKSVAPSLTLEMRTQDGTIIQNLPDSKPLSIALPRMENGELVEESVYALFRFEDTLTINDTELRQSSHLILAYKITLPVEFDTWNVSVRMFGPKIPMKMKVFDQVPDSESLEATPDLQPLSDNTSNLITIQIAPSTGNQFVPLIFYLGITRPSKHDSILSGSHSFFLQSHVEVCIQQTLATPPGPTQICKGRRKNINPLTASRTITCTCPSLGTYTAMLLPIRILKIMLDEIPYVQPYLFNGYNAVIVCIVALFIVSLFIFSFLRDHINNQYQDSFVILDDNYPTDDFVFVVGIFTGLYLKGGTSSKIAIKLIGSRSCSRVHVISKLQRNALSTGQDDWFLMTMNRPLGTLMSVHFWQDHHDLTGWYCERIKVYDIYDEREYLVNVNKWIIASVSDDMPQVEMIKVQSVTSNIVKEEGAQQETHSFFANYTRELQNTHPVLCFFIMHKRYLCSYEFKCYILIINILSIYMWIWFFQEVGYEWTHGKYLDPVSTLRLVGLSKTLFIWAFWAALLSHAVTFLLDYLYRFSHLSKLVQGRTTHPSYEWSGNWIAPHRRKSRKSKFSLSGLRMSVAGLYLSQSESISTTKHPDPFSSRHKWMSYVCLAVGPCQFRCVDVGSEIIALKTKHTIRFVRVTSLVIIAVLFSSLVVIEFYTEYQRKSRTCLVVVLLAIFLDALFISPILILLTSAIAFFIFKMNNEEKNWLSEERHIPRVPRIFAIDYVEIAMHKEYKPLLSSEIEDKRKQKFIRIIIHKALFHLVSLITMIVCVQLLENKQVLGTYYMTRAVKDSFMYTSHPRLKGSMRNINQVYNIESAVEYVSNTIADYSGVWQNGKEIGGSAKVPNVRWTFDYFGQGISATNFMVLLIYKDRQLVVPYEFSDYFIHANGPYTENVVITESVVVSDRELNYTIVSNNWIHGRTGTYYPFSGHRRAIPLIPWEEYSTTVKILMDEITNKCEDGCRALVISTNYIYPYVQYIMTVDVIFEFHQSGMTAPRIQVSGFKIGKLDTRLSPLRVILLCLFLLFAFYTIAMICRRGAKDYFQDLSNITKYLAFIALAIVVFFHAVRTPLKYSYIHQLFESSNSEYIDVHSVYAYEDFDSYALLFVFTILLIDFLLITSRFVGSEWLKSFSVSCIRVSILSNILEQYFVLMVREAAQMENHSYGYYLILVYTRQIPVLKQNSGRLDHVTLFYSTVILLTIMSRGLTAIIIYLSLKAKTDTSLPVTKYIEILKKKPDQPKPSERYRKLKVKELSSHSRSSAMGYREEAFSHLLLILSPFGFFPFKWKHGQLELTVLPSCMTSMNTAVTDSVGDEKRSLVKKFVRLHNRLVDNSCVLNELFELQILMILAIDLMIIVGMLFVWCLVLLQGEELQFDIFVTVMLLKILVALLNMFYCCDSVMKQCMTSMNTAVTDSARDEKRSLVKKFVRLHNRLVDNSCVLNESFELQILMILAIDLMIIVGMLFVWCLVLLQGEELQFDIFVAVMLLKILVAHLNMFYCCDSVMKQSEKFTNILANFGLDEVGGQGEIHKASQQSIIMHFIIGKKLKFTTYGGIVLDYRLLLSLTATCVTYLMILLQFNERSACVPSETSFNETRV
ncbi:hypothetical protein GE061_014549 [Apolygus lucorum]|uniref:EGF-like domain-containing protein n=1 Tax=Apolygus lucorum TaxID=248454 RepID=A0A8S9XKN0_APOLU|nr:hypothetical protein GE061_014549 [Apolygus lucorum]